MEEKVYLKLWVKLGRSPRGGNTGQTGCNSIVGGRLISRVGDCLIRVGGFGVDWNGSGVKAAVRKKAWGRVGGKARGQCVGYAGFSVTELAAVVWWDVVAWPPSPTFKLELW